MWSFPVHELFPLFALQELRNIDKFRKGFEGNPDAVVRCALPCVLACW